MRTLFALFLISNAANAQVVSPSSIEVKFSFESELSSRAGGKARDLALDQAKYLFSIMQTPEVVREFQVSKDIAGIGAPRWEPEVKIIQETKQAGLRIVRYRMSGLMLLHKTAAAEMLRRGDWQVELPYDTNNYFDTNCLFDSEHNAPEEFWYFADIYKRGCEKLRTAPLAHSVSIHFAAAPAVPENLSADLGTLRGENGNGDVFDIMAVNGFDNDSTSPKDDGRVNFEALNQWFRDQGFQETVLAKFKNRPIYLFEKTLQRPDGSKLQVRVTRLLANTDLDGSKNVTFAKFLKNALETSDVVIYEGHSGMGANLDLETIEKRLLLSKDKNAGDHIEFNRTKHQLFLFDSCSSYSYYLGMFEGRKDPGTLAVMSNGLESEFGYEIPMTKRLYKMLISVDNDDLTWSELLESFEKPLRGKTFMLSVDVNN